VPGHKIHKRRMIGVVTSDKMNKTRVVLVERRVSDPKYGKYLTSRTKYKAHDEKNEFKSGDRVQIVESRPLSRDKRWRVEKLIERARPPSAPPAVRPCRSRGGSSALPSGVRRGRGREPFQGSRVDRVEGARLCRAESV